MDGKLNVFEAISRRVEWLGQRQRVLAQNIANADTPNYLPRDLKQGPFSRLVARRLTPVAPATTHPDHLTQASRSRRSDEPEQKMNYEAAPSGNAVVVEEQMVKVAETQMAYQTMTNLYRKHLQMMKMALGRNS